MTLVLSPSVLGCRTRVAPPEPRETALVVAVDAVPLVEKPGEDVHARAVAYLGDVLVRLPQAAEVSVKADLEGGHPAFQGAFVGTRREGSGPMLLAPLGALAETSVLTATSLCSALPQAQRSGDCPVTLRRIALPNGAIFGYLPCLAGPCPTVLRDGARTETRTVEGLAFARSLRTSSGIRLVFEASSARAKQGPATRYEIRDPGPDQRLVLTLPGSSTTTAADGAVITRLVRVTFSESGARVVGTERIAASSRAASEVRVVDMTVVLPP